MLRAIVPAVLLLTTCALALAEDATKVPEARKAINGYQARIAKEQEALSQELRLLQAKYERSMGQIHAGHVAELTRVQEQRTRQGDLEGAMAVKTYLESVDEPMPVLTVDAALAADAIPDRPATFAIEAADVQPLTDGVKAFTNRNYTLLNVPAALRGWRFHRIAGGGDAPIRLAVARPGRIFMAVSNVSAYPDWRDEGEGFNYSDDGRTRLTVISKPCKNGPLELARLGWADMVLIPGR